MFKLDVPFEIVGPGERYHADVALVFVGKVGFHVLFYVGHALAAQSAALGRDVSAGNADAGGATTTTTRRLRAIGL